LQTATLKILSEVWQTKHFGNRSTFADVMIKSQVYRFIETQCTV